MNLRKPLKKAGKLSERALANLALLFIAAYRVILSPWMGGACRFYPSCSEYSRESFKTHGFLQGVLLTVRRVFRCRPGGGKGFDPVPSTVNEPRGVYGAR